MLNSKPVVIFLIACGVLYSLSGAVSYAGYRKQLPARDAARQKAIMARKKAARDSIYWKNEFLDTVLKRDRISYSFIHAHTLLTGYTDDSLRAAGAVPDSSWEAQSGPAYNYFKGNTVYYVNKRFAMAHVYHGSYGVGGEDLLLITDLQTNKNTDWVKGGYGYDGDGNDPNGSARNFQLKHDTVLVIENILEYRNKKGAFVTESEKYTLHINNEGRFVGRRPD